MLVPSMAMVEFLPVDESGAPLEGAEPLLATDVKVTQSTMKRKQGSLLTYHTILHAESTFFI